ncbi:MAG: signal peptidase [Acidobacteria bacterium]|nr:signal peptidase [Acidobacteriota bacterium]
MLAAAACVGLVVISGLFGVLGHVYHMPTGSMVPTLPIGSSVYALPAHNAARGEIVTFRYPLEPKTMFAKRVVAIGGDTVEIRDKVLSVNGKPVAEPYVVHEDETIYPLSPALPEPYRSRDQFGPYRVPPGELFLLGDNRDQSSDSRYWGTVPRRNLTGRVTLAFAIPRWFFKPR